MSERVSEADLHAWLDGRLDAARATAVEAWLAQRPEEAARLAAYRQAEQRLRERFDPVLDEAVPPRLIAAATARRGNQAWKRMAAIVLLATGSAMGGWMARGFADPVPDTSAGLARDAAMAHVVFAPDVRHPVEVAADQEAHLSAWLSKRLAVRVVPPRLESLGYTLVGGRLLPGDSGPVAQLMYRDAAGKRITLYLAPEHAPHGAAHDGAFAFSRIGALEVVVWKEARFGCALTGDVPRQELMRVGHAASAQLEAS